MSLLQGVLRSHTLSSQLNNSSTSPRKATKTLQRTDGDVSDDDGIVISPPRSRATTRPSSPGDDQDELINVVSQPGTPSRSRAVSRSSSPTRGASALGRPAPGPLHLPNNPRSPAARITDPLKALPTEVSQKIFGGLKISELARCSRVSRKWSRSQTINYVWFQHYRKENFQDTSLPQGKWTKRESKQNWRVIYIQSSPNRPTTNGNTPSRSAGSGYASPSQSGYQTPREMKEEKWRQEAEVAARPAKNEMREMYKELGGRKARGKGKLGGAGSTRDKGGWAEGDGGEGW